MPGVIRPPRLEDAGLILVLIRELADYERLADEVDATEAEIAAALFGATTRVEGWTRQRVDGGAMAALASAG